MRACLHLGACKMYAYRLHFIILHNIVYDHWLTGTSFSDFNVCMAFALNAENYVETLPDDINELRKRDVWPEWNRAIYDEMHALEKNRNWDLVDLPTGVLPVPCKWVFKIKYGDDGSIDRYKVRLVTEGCSQRQGYVYQETYRGPDDNRQDPAGGGGTEKPPLTPDGCADLGADGIPQRKLDGNRLHAAATRISEGEQGVQAEQILVLPEAGTS